jgi:surface-anchored protein
VVNGTPLVGDTEFEPGEVTTVVGKSGYDFIASAGGRPAGSAWDPIGIGAGNSFWFLPQAAAGPGGATALGLPLLGLGAEEVTLGAFDGNLMKITLVGAVMPTGGNFSMWTTDFGGNPTFAMSTYDGISAADMKLLDIGVSDHEHVNWGFTEAGLYELTFEFSALEGGILVSETATYTFAAIPEPSHYAAVLAAGTLAVFGIQRRMRLRLA